MPLFDRYNSLSVNLYQFCWNRTLGGYGLAMFLIGSSNLLGMMELMSTAKIKVPL